MTSYYIFNTNSQHLPDGNRGTDIYEKGIVATYGDKNTWGKLLDSLEVGDNVISYVNGAGAKAFGTVTEEWDGENITDPEKKVDPKNRGEYHVEVDWHLVLDDDSTIEKDAIREILGYDPEAPLHSARQPISDDERGEDIIEEMTTRAKRGGGRFENSTPSDLEPGTEYTASELRSIFNTQRAGRGIETRYDENGDRYLRLFSKEESEYGDDLDAYPMRYVGEKNFHNPTGDQVLKWGNGALAQSTDHEWPIYLFEKVSENPVTHLFRGKVEVVDYELNYRPQKDKREYDFYLRSADEHAERDVGNGDSKNDLAPGRLREVNPESRDIPDSEERISYESSKETQAEAMNLHEDTVAKLRDELESLRWTCTETEETDILAYTDTEALVIEVKSITDSNERWQFRKAIGQVLENCYRDVYNRGWGEKDLISCIALSQVPSDRFSGYIDFLQAEGIDTLWITNDGIAGHPESVEKLLG